MFTVYTDGPRDSRFVVIIYSGHDVKISSEKIDKLKAITHFIKWLINSD